MGLINFRLTAEFRNVEGVLPKFKALIAQGVEALRLFGGDKTVPTEEKFPLVYSFLKSWDEPQAHDENEHTAFQLQEIIGLPDPFTGKASQGDPHALYEALQAFGEQHTIEVHDNTLYYEAEDISHLSTWTRFARFVENEFGAVSVNWTNDEKDLEDTIEDADESIEYEDADE